MIICNKVQVVIEKIVNNGPAVFFSSRVSFAIALLLFACHVFSYDLLRCGPKTVSRDYAHKAQNTIAAALELEVCLSGHPIDPSIRHADNLSLVAVTSIVIIIILHASEKDFFHSCCKQQTAEKARKETIRTDRFLRTIV